MAQLAVPPPSIPGWRRGRGGERTLAPDTLLINQQDLLVDTGVYLQPTLEQMELPTGAHSSSGRPTLQRTNSSSMLDQSNTMANNQQRHNLFVARVGFFKRTIRRGISCMDNRFAENCLYL